MVPFYIRDDKMCINRAIDFFPSCINHSSFHISCKCEHILILCHEMANFEVQSSALEAGKCSSIIFERAFIVVAISIIRYNYEKREFIRQFSTERCKSVSPGISLIQNILFAHVEISMLLAFSSVKKNTSKNNYCRSLCDQR